MQERPHVSTVQHEITDALGVGRQIVVEISSLDHGEVQYVVEIRGQIGEAGSIGKVGLQNGGMATGLAMDVLKSAQAGLAPAIFGPWMNASGSVLASFWRRRPVAIPGRPAPAPVRAASGARGWPPPPPG